MDQLTARGLFSEQLQQAQDGCNLIVLNPLSASVVPAAALVAAGHWVTGSRG